jgi:KUP system potassium uptake protein
LIQEFILQYDDFGGSFVTSSPNLSSGPTNSVPDKEFDQKRLNRKVLALSIGALGVVYGDLGTSPLYTIRECFYGTHAIAPTIADILGALSLIFWTLTAVISIKYVVFILRADNRGEGGIFALLGLIPTSGSSMSPRVRSIAMLAGVVGAGLLYGDGIITPAITVLSAIEGLEIATKAAAPAVLPLTCVVLLLLFLLQHQGTAHIGKLFGPIMMIWFMSIAALGLGQIILEPRVLYAINPLYALDFFAHNGLHGIVVLGSVVLCITGGEALYADLGHFGRHAIRFAWFWFVYPALLLNYFGQGALLLGHPEMNINPFYGTVPRFLLYPMVGLTTIASVIASQALISGVFSLTQQAIQLGFCPRIHIVHTSQDIRGQIYIPSVNYALMLACIGVVIGFGESSGLAGAYGIAVTGTMTITSCLYFLVLTRNWNWSLWKAVPLVGIFLFFDIAYFGANLLKVATGGWFTLLVAALITVAMTTWRRGREELKRKLLGARLPLDLFMSDVAKQGLPRVSGTAVFMTVSPEGTPPTLLHHVKHNHMLHEKVVLLSIQSADFPTVPADERVQVGDLGDGFYRVVALYGFMQRPDVPQIMKIAARHGLMAEPLTTTYYLGRETLLTIGDSKMMRWRKALFALMSRNAGNPTAYFKLPANRVVEFGTQIEL